MEINFRSSCPISSALDIIGDKWSLLIIRDMMFFGKKTFSEFAGSYEKIATNILAARLAGLEQTGLISKSKLPENKKTNIYALTQTGIDYLPVLIEVILWSEVHLATHISKEMKQLAVKIRKDKAGFTKAYHQKLLAELKAK